MTYTSNILKLKIITPIFFFVSLVFLSLSTANAQNNLQKNDINTIKKEILSDPLFLSHLRDKLSADNINDDHIRRVIKDYLIQNPKIMLEVQQALIDQQSANNKSLTPEQTAKIINDNYDKIFKAKHDVALGNPNGDVTIVEFYDYNCGYCKKSFKDIEKLLKDDKNIHFIMKDFPILSDDSVKAHLIAQVIKQKYPNKYKEFHLKMMSLEAKATEESTLEVAHSLGLDINKIKPLITNQNSVQPLISNNEIATQLNINFTPAFIIGDQMVMGATDENALKSVISSVRAKGNKG